MNGVLLPDTLLRRIGNDQPLRLSNALTAAWVTFWLWAVLALVAPVALAQESVPSAAGDTPPTRVGAAGTSIGRVVIASGLVEAEGANGRRVLKKGDPVFEGDVLRTDPAGRTQITFSDGARLAVRPATRLAIEAYHDADPGRSEQVAFRLERGGFRTATGRLGRVNRSAYRFSTPQAVIGIRGTEWGAQMVEDEEGSDPSLEIGVIDGGITVTNDGGSVDLGEGANFAFATVQGFGNAPTGSTEPPAGLADVLQMQLQADGNGEDGSADAGTTAEDGQAEDGEEEGTDQEDSSEEGSSEDGASEEGASEDGSSAEGSSAEGSSEEGSSEVAASTSSTPGDDTSSAGDAGGEAAEIEFGGASSTAGDDGGIVFEYGDRCF